MTQNCSTNRKRLVLAQLGIVLAWMLVAACDEAVCPIGTMEVNAHCVPKPDAALDSTAGASTVPPQGVTGDGTTTSPAGATPSNGVGGANMSMMSASESGTGVPSGSSGGASGTNSSQPGSGNNGSNPSSSANGSAGSTGNGATIAGTGSSGSSGTAGNGNSMSGGVTCSPSAEECDNMDNDCDGRIDEAVAPMPCGNAMPPCKQGMKTCQNGVWSTECVGEVGPQKEICDGVDNDCTGSADEGCACTNGETQACGNSNPPCMQGKKTCVNGQWSATCEGEVKPGTEVCDGVDNDCNRTEDDGGDRLCTGSMHCAGPQKCVECLLDQDCNAKTNACNTGYCDLATHRCQARPKAERTACVDGAVSGFCGSGRCVPTTIAPLTRLVEVRRRWADRRFVSRTATRH